jgi:hypothetical protein
MAEISIPRTLVPVAQLPLLGTGKVDLVGVQRLAEQTLAASPGAIEAEDAPASG